MRKNGYFRFNYKISSLIVAVGVILFNINKIFNPIYKKINELEKNQCKNFLVDFLAKVENKEKITDCQKNRAYEIYDHYINDLKGNSFIKDKWERLIENER